MKQHTDHQNKGSFNATGGSSKSPTHGQAGTFGDDQVNGPHKFHDKAPAPTRRAG